MRPAPSARAGLVLALTLAVGGLVGCRPGTALHNRYNNFRAYYNTYYNASRSLEAGERSLQRGTTPVDRSVLLPVFPVTSATGGQSGPFQDAIDKSAELLRERGTSKWADDALLVIGKAYFYQRNVVGAEQKFRETMAAAEQTGDRRLGDEARFWLGRTLAVADRFDEGVAVLEEGLLDGRGDRRWTSRMRLALGELYARAGRWDEAAAALREGAPEVGDPDIEARAYVLLGQVEEHAGRYDEAAAAYADALEARPAYELAFAAEVNRALVLGLDAGRPEAALDVVGRMLRDDKHYERRGELALVRARVLAAAGRPEAALEQFRDVLYDDALNASAVRGQAHYRLGEFYRDRVGDYVLASAHFDTAATVVRQPDPAERPARGAILDLADEATTYNLLATAARGIAEADSLLALGALSEEAFRARVDEIEAERRRVFAAEQRRLQAQREAQAFSGGGGVFENRAEGTPGAASAGGAAQDAGFLNYRSPEATQVGYVTFAQRWGDRPLVPNWRRSAAVRAGAIASEVGGRSDAAGRNPFAFGEGPPPLDLSPVPRTPAQRAEMVTTLAGLRYELANAFFLSLGRADTAAALYRAILADTPDLPVATRAQYALGEIEMAAGRPEAARPHYEAVIAADPEGALAQASRARLSRNVVEVDTTVQTSAAYDAARRRWTAGSPREAAADLLALADGAPDDPLAPRAYLAAAVAYIEATRPDTVALGGPLPPDLVSPVLLEVAIGLEPEPAAPDAPAETPAPDDAMEGPRRELVEEQAATSEAAPRLLDEALPAQDDGLRPAPGVPDSEVEVPVDVDVRQSPPAPPSGDRAETLSVADGSGGADPEAAPAVTDSTSFTLHDHLRALAALYPETPAGTRASALRADLPPRWVPSDTVAVDPMIIGGPAADSLQAGVASPPDTSAAPEGAVADRPQTLFGPEALDFEAGALSWRLQTLSIPTEGEAVLGVLQGAGYRAVLARELDSGAYALLAGQFTSVDEAQTAAPFLPAWAQQRGEIVRLDRYTLAETDTNPRDDF